MNPTQLCGVAPHPMYTYFFPCEWVGLKPYIETKFYVSYSFDSVSEAHESKEVHL